MVIFKGPFRKRAPLCFVPLFLLPGRGCDGLVGAMCVGQWSRKMAGVWILDNCGIPTPAQNCFLPDIFYVRKKKSLGPNDVI